MVFLSVILFIRIVYCKSFLQLLYPLIKSTNINLKYFGIIEESSKISREYN